MQVERHDASSVALPTLRSSNLTADNGQAKVGPSPVPGVERGIRISLSEAGNVQSKQASKNQDIDDSNLPDNIKKILKMIRQLRAELAAKKAELDAILAKPTSPDTQRQADAVSTEIAALIGALSSANASLVLQMRKQNLSREQLLSIAGFVAS